MLPRFAIIQLETREIELKIEEDLQHGMSYRASLQAYIQITNTCTFNVYGSSYDLDLDTPIKLLLLLLLLIQQSML